MSSIPTLTKMRTYANNAHVLTFYNACPNSIYNLSLHVLLIVLMSILRKDAHVLIWFCTSPQYRTQSSSFTVTCVLTNTGVCPDAYWRVS